MIKIHNGQLFFFFGIYSTLLRGLPLLLGILFPRNFIYDATGRIGLLHSLTLPIFFRRDRGQRDRPSDVSHLNESTTLPSTGYFSQMLLLISVQFARIYNFAEDFNHNYLKWTLIVILREED